MFYKRKKNDHNKDKQKEEEHPKPKQEKKEIVNKPDTKKEEDDKKSKKVDFFKELFYKSNKNLKKVRHDETTTRYDEDDVDPTLKDKHRMNKFLRSSILVDYKTGICKDFRDTGFCGFGDNCIFMHDRSDLYTGWELDNMFKYEEYKKKFLTRKRQMPKIKPAELDLKENDED